jgi:hypothetical protein
VTWLENNQQNTKTVTNSKKKIAAITVILAIIVAAVLTSGLLTNGNNPSSNQASNQNNPQSWIKIGTYATYEGQATILSMSVSFNAKMQIVNLNQTHIQVLTDFNMSTPFGATENTTTTWINTENMTFQPEGSTLNNSYITQITLPNLGTRTCTVYEYNSQGLSATYYIDDKVQWPIKIVMTSPTVDGQSYNMDITLVDTNISGL